MPPARKAAAQAAVIPQSPGAGVIAPPADSVSETRDRKLDRAIAKAKKAVRADMAEMETRLMVRLGAITIGGITVLGVFLGALIALVQ